MKTTYLLSRLVVLAALGSQLEATTIVGVWTEKKVTIVADSKITVIGRGGRSAGSLTGCKVHVVDGAVVAFSGLLRNEAVDVIAAVKQSQSFRDSVSNRPLPATGPMIAAQLAVEKALAARLKDHSLSILEVSLLIATLEDGKPTLTRAEWFPLRQRLPEQLESNVATDGVSLPRYATRQFKYPQMRSHSPNPNRGVEIIGRSDAIMAFAKLAPREWWNDPDAVGFAKKLVALEANDPENSAFVGLPLTVVTVDEQGIQWVERGACKE